MLALALDCYPDEEGVRFYQGVIQECIPKAKTGEVAVFLREHASFTEAQLEKIRHVLRLYTAFKKQDVGEVATLLSLKVALDIPDAFGKPL